MIVAISRLNAPPQADLEGRFAKRPKLVDRHPGFRRLQLVQGRGTHEYLLIMEWESMESFRAYMQSADFDHAHPDLPEGVTPGGLQVFDTLIDSSDDRSEAR